jgi:hypothetical protein
MRTSFKFGAAIGILTIISAAAGWYFSPKSIAYNESFEQNFSGWTGDADVPPDPNNPGSNIEWNVSRTTSPAKSGQHSVELYIDGRQDDGTVWIEKMLSIERNAQVQVNVSFDLYSESESLNVITAVVAFGKSVRWETEMTYNVDDIKVTITRKLELSLCG